MYTTSATMANPIYPQVPSKVPKKNVLFKKVQTQNTKYYIIKSIKGQNDDQGEVGLVRLNRQAGVRE